ncbi:hypothetical protein JCM10908_006404 [Rhodotorula pacifica]|uniref:uncharacterized protein n=1 Tax=Rhodotorula pacifica TaxID=1495444 RepID=UPI0031773379
MLQLKSIQDARRPRANLTGCPARLHTANSLAGRASPTSGTLRTGFVGVAGGSGRALAGGRAHRGLGGAHWLNKQGAHAGLKCRAVAVDSPRSSPEQPAIVPVSSKEASTRSPQASEDPAAYATSPEAVAQSEISATEREAAAALPTRPRMPARMETEGYEIVATADVPLIQPPGQSPSTLADLDDWELVSSEDLPK